MRQWYGSGCPVVTTLFERYECFKSRWQAGVTGAVEIGKEGVIFPGFATKSFFSLNLSAPSCPRLSNGNNTLCTALESAVG